MIDLLLSISTLTGIFLCTYGWGRLVSRVTYGDQPLGAAFAAALGLAALVGVGGLLVAGRLASVPTLYLLFGLGICLAGVFFVGDIRSGRTTAHLRSFSRGQWALRLLPHSFALICLLFLVITLMPSSAFNWNDDFQTYMARPIRMLQTGTLGGPSFETIGVDSLGAQSFLQSLLLIWLPLRFLNGFDFILCFTLCLLLIVEFSRYQGAHWLLLAAALVLFTLVNPQTVNVSALYSGSLMLLGLISSTCLLIDRSQADDLGQSWRAAIPVALFLSAAVLLKNTFVIFVFVYGVLAFGLLMLLGPRRRSQVGLAIFVGATSLAIILTWAMAHFEKYARIFSASGTQMAEDGPAVNQASPWMDKLGDLFTARELFYGGRLSDYTFLVAVVATAGVLSAILLWRRSVKARDLTLVPVLAASGAVTLSYLLTTCLVRPPTAVRYSCPLLIAILPIAVLSVGRHFLLLRDASPVSEGPLEVDPIAESRTERRKGKRRARQQLRQVRRDARRLIMFRRWAVTAVLVLQGFVIALFADELIDRVRRAYRTHTMVSYPTSEPTMRYCETALADGAEQHLQDIQQGAASGEKIVAYVTQPFHLDFARNQILVLTEGGILWAGWPVRKGAGAIRQHLLDADVRYVLWEYRGFGVKPDSDYERYMRTNLPAARIRTFSHGARKAELILMLREALGQLLLDCQVVHDDGGIALIDLSKSRASME